MRKTLLALMPLCFRERLGTVKHGGRFERGGADSERNDCSVCNDAQYNNGSFRGSLLLVDLPHVGLSMVFMAVFHLCMHMFKITRRCRR